MTKIRDNRFAAAAIIIMTALFVINLVLSRGCNRLMIMLTGGGKLVDTLAATPGAVYAEGQVWRLVSYGYLQPAVWHLAANAFALWYVGVYLRKTIGTARLVVAYHVGLTVACAVFLQVFSDGLMYGASPAVFCCLGMMAVWLLRDHTLLQEYKAIRGSRYLLCYLALSNFVGVDTFAVHMLGFGTGALLGLVIRRKMPDCYAS